jgi:opacity protein-like surface antigen
MRLSAARAATLPALVAAALALTAPAIRAQRGGEGYLFHRPDVQITLRGGYAAARAGSDLFDFATNELTLKRSDFSGITAGLDIGIPLTSRLDVVLDAGWAHASKGSEFRHFVDNKDRPIEQTTRFDRVPLTANLRYNLMPTGRTVGRLAWIPSTVVPWVGAGGGVMWYRFEQQGDFVDFKTNAVFPSTYNSSNWTPAGQVMAGVDYSLTPSVGLSLGARYLLARGTLQRDFNGFDRIDLSGGSVTAGFLFRI